MAIKIRNFRFLEEKSVISCPILRQDYIDISLFVKQKMPGKTLAQFVRDAINFYLDSLAIKDS